MRLRAVKHFDHFREIDSEQATKAQLFSTHQALDLLHLLMCFGGSVKNVLFLVILFSVSIGNARSSNKKKAADPAPTVIKLERSKKSHADLNEAISESFQGRTQIQKEVQDAAGIEKPTYEPVREAIKIEIPRSVVAGSAEETPEPKFNAPKRGPASSDTKVLMQEIRESESDD